MRPDSLTATRRNANLDLLRATAILLVIVYHVVQMWPVPLETLRQYTALGAYGVDLFFVLSGWLVGGLYWREHKVTGRVGVGRFISRRVLRTVPCYLVALAFSWGAVRMSDPQRGVFDPSYLLFLQNYKVTMPYFLVSWSLCIEEHFYLILPLTMALLKAMGTNIGRLWPLCLMPLLARAAQSYHDVGGFGYPWTATHLRFEGLLAGVLAARLHCLASPSWQSLVKWSGRLFVPVLATAVILHFTAFRLFYTLGLTLIALAFLLLLVKMVAQPPLRLASHPAVKAIALGSYSMYLTHALMIHLSRQTIQHLSIHSNTLYGLVFASFILIGGGLFYVLVEKPSLLLRDRLLPASPPL